MSEYPFCFAEKKAWHNTSLSQMLVAHLIKFYSISVTLASDVAREQRGSCPPNKRFVIWKKHKIGEKSAPKGGGLKGAFSYVLRGMVPKNFSPFPLRSFLKKEALFTVCFVFIQNFLRHKALPMEGG